MCGIAGLIIHDRQDLEEIVREMSDRLYSRGPDDSGVWADRANGVALGHRRLSVLDLSSAGHQPMHSPCGRYVMVFNGEIYNHLDMRDELMRSGKAPAWRGHSDSETLAAGISAWGLAATLTRAVGMFALAVWDRQTRKLQLARDRMGEKPLFYGWCGKAFLFGSELKALRGFRGFNNPVNRDALALYMQFCTVPAPYSIYRDVHKVMPGAIVTIPLDLVAQRRSITESYWTYAKTAREASSRILRDEKEAISELENRLKTAVMLQSVADVSLGAFLSGGVDSSTVVALMQAQSDRRVQTFTIGFDEPGFDESPYARAVAAHLGTEHHEHRVRAEDAREVIPHLPTLYDEPFADSSQIPTYLVCKAARQKVTVALSGDGGDELFGGYNRYTRTRQIWNRIGRIPFSVRHALGSAATLLPPQAWDRMGRILPRQQTAMQFGYKVHRMAHGLKSVRKLDDLHRRLVSEWPADVRVVLGSKPLATMLDDPGVVAEVNDPEHRMMIWDALTFLPDDILTKVDRAAMGVSLETRVPFLDPGVIDLAWRLPLNMKIRNGQGKWALRQVLYKYVPARLIERPKAGFAIPVGEWLRGPLRDWAEDMLDENRLKHEGYFDPALVRTTWSQHLSRRNDWTPRLWSVLMFQAWAKSLD